CAQGERERAEGGKSGGLASAVLGHRVNSCGGVSAVRNSRGERRDGKVRADRRGDAAPET
ncbi:hypothetical protein, partial [Deinococcus sp. Arct2-2]|uniref:hypothetical protein n=1 Tax=Deinococcus sp. Arct2-2 TaxID=2568653 RepID=UPI00197AE7CC